MSIVKNFKYTFGFGKKLPSSDELEKEIMRLSYLEDQTINEIRALKIQWKNLYNYGRNKDRYEKKQALRKMNRIEADIAAKDTELAKIDIGIRAVEKMNSVLSKGKKIFSGELWNKVEKQLDSEQLGKIIIEENFNEKRILKRLSNIANINNRNIIDSIEQIPDEDIDAVWGKETVDTGDDKLEEILNRKIEMKKGKMDMETL